MNNDENEQSALGKKAAENFTLEEIIKTLESTHVV